MEKILKICDRCGGSGVARGGGLQPPENPCSKCLGTGKSGEEEIDLSTADDQAEAAIAALNVKVDAMIVELDYIHGKVTAIWNQVKPGA